MPREEVGEAIKETEEEQMEAVVAVSKDTGAVLEAVEANKDIEEGLEQLLAEGWGAEKVVGMLVEWITLNRS